LKWRTFETYNYNFTRKNKNDIVPEPDWFLQTENIWTTSYDDGTYLIGNFEPANNFDARQNIFGGYVKLEHPVLQKLKFIYGIRVEQALMYYTGQNNTGSVIYNDEETLNELNVLPSLNIVYKLNDNMNLRLSGSQTVARPSFREKSIAQIFDPISKRTFIGNLDLRQTSIINTDLRYEWFITPRELFAVSAFYKQFDGHIEMVAFETNPDNYTPRNSGDASVYGIEIELRKALASIENSSFLRRLFFSGNFSYIQSQVDMKSIVTGTSGQTEYELRQNNLRDGETLDQFRPMAGQSPYMVNATLSYEVREVDMNVSLAYNVQGEQLSIVSSGRVPDVYTIPFHSLNFNIYKGFGMDFKHRITLRVTNILNARREMVYKSYGAEDEVFSSFQPQTGFALAYRYKF
jgi:outer membrane receptor protein involved in Fe transport